MFKYRKSKPATRQLKGDFQGITLERSATGALSIDVSALNGVDVTIVTNGDGRIVKQAPVEEAANISVYKRAYKIGAVLPDGWIVGPVSPTTGKPIAIEPVAGALEGLQTWYRGEDHAKELRGQGHAGARQPDTAELNALFRGFTKATSNQHAQFDTSGSNRYGMYWSSAPDRRGPDSARVQCFNGNSKPWPLKSYASARVRCVRDEPRIKLAGGPT